MNLTGSMTLSMLLHGAAMIAVAAAWNFAGIESAPTDSFEPPQMVRAETFAAFEPPPVAPAAVPDEPTPTEPQPEPVEEVAEQVTPEPRERAPRRERSEPEAPSAPAQNAPERAADLLEPVDSSEAPTALPEATPEESVAEASEEADDDTLPDDQQVAFAPSSDDSNDDSPLNMPVNVPSLGDTHDREEPARQTAEEVAAPGVDIDALLAAYEAQLNALVGRAYSYPRVAQRAGLRGTVLVEVRIDTQGNITSVRIANSSGHRILDNAAIDAISSLEAFPAPPNDVPWNNRSITIPMHYSPNA